MPAAMRMIAPYGYLGNVAEEEGGEDTRCPGRGTVVLRRAGLSLVETRREGGACPACR